MAITFCRLILALLSMKNTSPIRKRSSSLASEAAFEIRGEGEKRLRVLLAEDSALYRRLTGGLLKAWGMDVVIAKDGSEAWRLLQESGAPHLALLDWVLPEVDCIELCSRIRENRKGDLYTYVILLTGKDGKDDLIEGMQAGADDYLIKPFEPSELKARLFAGKRILDLQQELIAARESLRIAATYDPLTKLLNRGQILRFLDSELARAKREQTPVGIILTDVDHFKAVNDSLGHLAGDAVLVEVGKRLRANLRVYDGAGRYGGEEFLMVLPGCDLIHACNRAEEIRKAMSSESVKINVGTGPLITLSFGVTVATPRQKVSRDDLLRQADAALYQAKHAGRNCVKPSTAR